SLAPTSSLCFLYFLRSAEPTTTSTISYALRIEGKATRQRILQRKAEREAQPERRPLPVGQGRRWARSVRYRPVVAIRLSTVACAHRCRDRSEARFQQSTVVRPLPCLIFGRC